jgi:L-threonylcarbamoyladenylate synthase
MRILEANEESIGEAAAIIRLGGVVIYPTDTVYGLGCLPSDPEATKRVCEIKKRRGSPLPLACHTREDAKRIVEWNRIADNLAGKFWPGSLMLILPAKIYYPMWVTGGSRNLGVRIPDHQVSLELIRLSGGVLVSTSANKSGETPPKNANEAVMQIGDQVDLILDAGPAPLNLPSTVLDLTGDELKILREGPVTLDEIHEALNGL